MCAESRRRRAREPEDGRPLVLDGGMVLAADVGRLPMHVGRAPQRKADHAGGNGAVAQLVDQDEPAEIAVFGVRLERDRPVRGNVDGADGIELQRLRRQVLHRVDVDLVLGLGDGGGRALRAHHHPIRTARQHRRLVHPDQRRLELIGRLHRAIGGREDIAARAVDLVGKADRDGLAGHGLGEIPVEGCDPADGRRLSRGQHADRILNSHRAAGDQARETAEIQVGPINPLNRHAERLLGIAAGVDLDGFEMRDERRPGVPGHMRGARGDVVALEAGDG